MQLPIFYLLYQLLLLLRKKRTAYAWLSYSVHVPWPNSVQRGRKDNARLLQMDQPIHEEKENGGSANAAASNSKRCQTNDQLTWTTKELDSSLIAESFVPGPHEQPTLCSSMDLHDGAVAQSPGLKQRKNIKKGKKGSWGNSVAPPSGGGSPPTWPRNLGFRWECIPFWGNRRTGGFWYGKRLDHYGRQEWCSKICRVWFAVFFKDVIIYHESAEKTVCIWYLKWTGQTCDVS